MEMNLILFVVLAVFNINISFDTLITDKEHTLTVIVLKMHQHLSFVINYYSFYHRI